MTDQEMALFQLATMVLSDKVAGSPYLVYAVVETSDNMVSGLNRIGTMFKERVGPESKYPLFVVGIGGFSHPVSGYGPGDVRRALESYGLPSILIREINYSDAPTGPNNLHHTGSEMAMVVRYALENDYKSLGLVAAPFHQLRCYLHALTAAHRADQEVAKNMRIFNYPGWPLPWTEEAAYGQGDSRGLRSSFPKREFKKIMDYWRRGDLIAPSMALDYFLCHRDSS